jgi:hypothetical protein
MTYPTAHPPPSTPLPEDALPTAGEGTTTQPARAKVAVVRLAAVILVGTALWLVPAPSGVQPRAWHLLAVFVATMAGIMLRPIPMGAMAFVAADFAWLIGTSSPGCKASLISAPHVVHIYLTPNRATVVPPNTRSLT